MNTVVQCLTHPTGESLILRQDFLAICKNDPAAAALLQRFERWTNERLAKRDDSKTQRLDEEADLWLKLTIPDLQKALLGMFSKSKIISARDKLVEWGFLEKRRPPDKPLSNALQYRLNVKAVQAALDKLAPIPPTSQTPELANAVTKASIPPNGKPAAENDKLSSENQPKPAVAAVEASPPSQNGKPTSVGTQHAAPTAAPLPTTPLIAAPKTNGEIDVFKMFPHLKGKLLIFDLMEGKKPDVLADLPPGTQPLGDSTVDAVWQATLAYLEARVRERKGLGFELYAQGSRACALKYDTLLVAVRNCLVQRLMPPALHQTLKKVLNEIVKEHLEIRFVLPDEARHLLKTAEKSAATRAVQELQRAQHAAPLRPLSVNGVGFSAHGSPFPLPVYGVGG